MIFPGLTVFLKTYFVAFKMPCGRLVVSVFGLIVLGCAYIPGADSVSLEYQTARQELVNKDIKRQLGGSLVLSADEMRVSDLLLKEKIRMMEESRRNRTAYVPSLSFYQSKPLIQNSTILNLIRMMPKGAALHLHDTSATSIDWLVKNATYREHVYMCVSRNDGLINFNVFLVPSNMNCDWRLVSEERARASSADAFDEMLKRNLTLLASDPLTTYVDNAKVWVRFSRYFSQVQNLIYYAPVFKDYFWRTLEEFRADNIQYIEIRSYLKGVFELDGTVHDAEFGLQLYQNITRDFVRQYPDFIGAKVIMCGLRNYKLEDVMDEVKTAMALNRKYPDLMLGYDLVGNEAFFNPLTYYLDALTYPMSQNPPFKLNYYFHVGETNWQGTATDDNMLDALLLNCTRMGHGYALPKRPELLAMVKERNIPVEVNPVSNQMLRLVSDPRNHPMVPLLADDFPLVVTSDDVAVWEALPLSHDIYMAFMDMSGQDAGLAFLKQLAINSIRFSSMNEQEKTEANRLWEKKWASFIQYMVTETDGRSTTAGPRSSATRHSSCLNFLVILAVSIGAGYLFKLS